MPKLKTNKATQKRFKITRKKKILNRRANQNHYNAKESGNEKRKKRGKKLTDKTNYKLIRSKLPYA